MIFIIGFCSLVEIFGTGGCTVDKTIRFDVDMIRSTAPNVLVIEMGSNDACKKDSDAKMIVSSLIVYCNATRGLCGLKSQSNGCLQPFIVSVLLC